jgi:hypothetical protein
MKKEDKRDVHVDWHDAFVDVQFTIIVLEKRNRHICFLLSLTYAIML